MFAANSHIINVKEPRFTTTVLGKRGTPSTTMTKYPAVDGYEDVRLSMFNENPSMSKREKKTLLKDKENLRCAREQESERGLGCRSKGNSTKSVKNWAK